MSNPYNLRSTPTLQTDPPIRVVEYQDLNARRLARQNARNRSSSFSESSTTSFFENLLHPPLQPLPTSGQSTQASPSVLVDQPQPFGPSLSPLNVPPSTLHSPVIPPSALFLNNR